MTDFLNIIFYNSPSTASMHELIEIYANIFSSILTGVVAILGLRYLKPLKDKTLGATFTFWSQLSVRLIVVQKWIKLDPSVLNNMYSPEARMGLTALTSKEYKKNYQRLMTASIVIGFLIPVTSVLADGSLIMKIILAALGSATTAISAFLRMKNYYELWTHYRCNHEYLLSTLYAYFTKNGIFKTCANQNECDTLLIEACETCFNRENQRWIELFEEDVQTV